jgi:hypothetical protein
MTMPMSNSVVNNSIDRATFEDFYAGPVPWDIGKPQGQFTRRDQPARRLATRRSRLLVLNRRSTSAHPAKSTNAR